MTNPATSTSGTSKPALLPHPGYLRLDDHFNDLLCYVLRDPGPPGPALVLWRSAGDCYAQFGDWAGNPLGPQDEQHRLHRPVQAVLLEYLPKLLTLMQYIGLTQAEYYFTDNLCLSDVRLSLNKFSGPGMLRDIFGKLVPTPELVKLEVLDPDVLRAIRSGSGSYSGPLLIKPSRYRWLQVDATCVPLYARLER